MPTATQGLWCRVSSPTNVEHSTTSPPAPPRPAACIPRSVLPSACGDTRLAPNTCGNRACPHCQGADRAAWVAERSRELLPGVGFFHAVFTVPPAIRRLAQIFPRVVLDALLRASADAVLTLCRDPDRLGAEVGLVEVLRAPHLDPRSPLASPRPSDRHRRRLGWRPPLLGGGHASGRQRTSLPASPARPAGRLHTSTAISATPSPVPNWPAYPSFGGTWPPWSGGSGASALSSPRRITAHDPAANAGAGSVTWTYATNADPDRTQIRVASRDRHRQAGQRPGDPRHRRSRAGTRN